MKIVLIFGFLCLSGDFCNGQYYLQSRKGIEHPKAELMYSREVDGNGDYEFVYTVPAVGEIQFHNITKYEISSSVLHKNHVQGVAGGEGKNFVQFALWIIPESKMLIKVWGIYLNSSPCKK